MFTYICSSLSPNTHKFPDCDWMNPTMPATRKSNDPQIMEGWAKAFEENQQQIPLLPQEDSA